MAATVLNDAAWRNKLLLVSTLALVSVACWQRWNVPTLRRLGSSSSSSGREQNEASSINDSAPSPKPVSASSVHMSCRVTPDITDEHGRLYAGEMLKIIDVAAGVAARRHTDLNCVTISLDRVILVREIRSGDVVHVDACINRAWGSSLEAGVRVLLEDEDTGELVYCCHAYLTFVALAPAPASHSGPPPSLRLGNSTSKSNQARKKAVVAPIIPHTLIEKKRYLFAGRRRVMRTSRPAEDLTVLRTAVASMIPIHAKRQWASESGSSVSSSAAGSGRTSPRADQDKRQARELRSLELELLADALEARDPHVHVDEGDVVRADAGVYGPDAPAVPLADLEIILEKRKKGRRPTWVGLRPDAMPVAPLVEWAIHNPPGFSPDSGTIPRPLLSPTVATISLSDPSRPRKLRRASSDLQPIAGPDETEPGPGSGGFDIPRMVHMQDTLACTIQIVMPQHANSVGVLFGGQLMEWMERTAVLAAHRLKRDCAWVTAGMDGLLFREAVATGEALTFRAVVTRVWTSSVEVYVCSHADVRRPYPPPPEGSQPGPGPASRFTNEAFLTLVALTPTPPRGSFGVHASPARWMHERHLPPLQEETNSPTEDKHLHRRRSTMLPPTSANPVRIGAAIVEPSRAPLRDIVRSAEKRRIERLDMREMLLR